MHEPRTGCRDGPRGRGSQASTNAGSRGPPASHKPSWLRCRRAVEKGNCKGNQAGLWAALSLGTGRQETEEQPQCRTAPSET